MHVETLTADAVCPVEGATSADAQVANLRLLDEAIDADADLPVDPTVPVDLGIEEVVSAEATVTLNQIERTGADDAHAAALVVDVHVRAVLSDQEVAEVDVGEIVLAEAACQRPAEGAAEGGAPDEGQEPTSDEGDGSEDEGAPGDEIGLPEGDEGDGASDGDADAPSADALEPDAGPAEGGTEVTVEGTEVDATEQVTIDGTEVDFEGRRRHRHADVRHPRWRARPRRRRGHLRRRHERRARVHLRGRHRGAERGPDRPGGRGRHGRWPGGRWSGRDHGRRRGRLDRWCGRCASRDGLDVADRDGVRPARGRGW